jgi:hypothetical protein
MTSSLKRRIGLWHHCSVGPLERAVASRIDLLCERDVSLSLGSERRMKTGNDNPQCGESTSETSTLSPIGATLSQLSHSIRCGNRCQHRSTVQLDYPPGRLLLNWGFGLGGFDCRAGATSLLTTLGVGVSPGTTLLHIAAGFLALPPIGYYLLVVNQQSTTL